MRSFPRLKPNYRFAGRALILGDGWIRNAVTDGAHVFAVDRLTGELHWVTRVHEQIASIVTSSPIVHNDVAYVGIAAKEETGKALTPKEIQPM